jgi:light-regulated signal transduction histidine kinase (bacteriophytochrome)
VDNALTRQPMTEEKLETLKLFAGYAGLAIENARWNATLEQRVIERTAELETANRELQDFTYTIAHDLRAPARAMIGFSRLLQEENAGQLDTSGQHYLNRVNYGARRMGQMIDELLAFTHLGRQTLRREPVDMLALVHHVLEEFQPERVGRQIEVIIGSLPDSEADPEMLEQVWRHLLSNAFKFTWDVPHPRIIIGVKKQNGEQQYSVQDNGVGFDVQHTSKLFGVFQRLHLEEEFEGTGMGLAIVHRIVQRHGGKIWAEAEVDKGATFYFTLAPRQETL